MREVENTTLIWQTHWKMALRPTESDATGTQRLWVEDGAAVLDSLIASGSVTRSSSGHHTVDVSLVRQALVAVAASFTPAAPYLGPNTMPPQIDDMARVLAEWCQILPCDPACGRACTPAVFARVTAALPCLIRLLATRLRYWADTLRELDRRLEQDREVLQAHFGVHGEIDRLEFPAGDEHRKGRAAALLRFTSGGAVAYKPRSQSLLHRLGRIAAQLNTNRPALEVCFPPALDRGTYGWADYIHSAEAVDRASALVHYRRLGQAAALSWVLAASDIHLGNIVLADDALHIIDEEVFGLGIVHDNPSLPSTLREELRFLQASPVHTGIFPYRTPLPGRAEGVDFSPYSALGAAAPTLSPSLAENGTRDSHGVAFLDGYDEMLATFADRVQTDQVLRQQIIDLSSDSCRLVPLSTARYSELLSQSLHPDHLTSGKARQDFFEAELLANSAFHPWRDTLIADEVDDLFNGDVPLFCGPIDGCFVQGGSGEHHEILDHTGREVLLHRLKQLPFEQASARWQASAAIECAARNRNPRRVPPRPRSTPDQHLDDSSLCLEGAHQLLLQLRDLAVETIDGGLAWADIRHDPRRLHHVGHCGTSIRSGTSGILLTATLLQSSATNVTLATTAAELADRLAAPWLREVEHLSRSEGLYVLGELCDRLPVAAELLRCRPDDQTHTVVAAMLSSIQRSIPYLDRQQGEDASVTQLGLLSSALLLPSPFRQRATDAAHELLSRPAPQPYSHDAQLAHLLAQQRFSHQPPRQEPAPARPPHTKTSSAFFSPWTDSTYQSLAARALAATANTSGETWVEPDLTLLTEEILTSPVHGHGLAEGEAGRISVLALISDDTTAAAAARMARAVLNTLDRGSSAGYNTIGRPGLWSGMAGTAYELARWGSDTQLPSLLLPARLAEPGTWDLGKPPPAEHRDIPMNSGKTARA
ncbi:type 2 lanthipeptide synthetase LanM [Streptomyces sp. NPDC050485]|uniref:type 2 lanthipeptide synthetase LanM n=1 Tax=Streptomyces sp. NPDC050485 TaxID=3365617 RepID=UPI00378E357C